LDQFIGAVLSIVLIDIVLSGDNAIVIGMAVRNLPEGQKRRAILAGGGGALLLRVLLTAVTALLLSVPLLQAAGGLLLVWITYRLLAPGHSEEGHASAGRSFGQAMWTIIVADLTMSIDNMLAVGAAAHGDLGLLLFGLGLSMAIIIAGGSVVAGLLQRLPWLIYVGGGVLLLLAGEMISKDTVVVHALGHEPWYAWAISGVFAAALALLLWMPWRRGGAMPPQSPA